jgi:hypothetical protein
MTAGRTRNVGRMRVTLLLGAVLALVWSLFQPAAFAHIQHFTHFLQLSDDCYPNNCPHFLATTRRIDGTNDFIYVQLTIDTDSDPTAEFFDNKMCFGGCYVKRIEKAGYPAKHNRSYTIDATSGHACGHNDQVDDDCRFFNDTGSYDSSGVCLMNISTPPMSGHCHSWLRR